MNWQYVYECLVNAAKAKNRIKVRYKKLPNYVYYENHHVLPKCLNGTNNKDNLVLLTAREHYICHKLLTHIYPENRKLVNAFHTMTFDKRGRNVSSRDYAYAKELKALTPITEETRKKMKAAKRKSGPEHPWYGQKHSDETIEKLQGPKSADHKLNMSLAKKGKSYDEIFGENSDNMKLQRHLESAGNRNGNARKYIIFNSKMNQKWFCHGNLVKFGEQFHVSGKTFILSRKRNEYVNFWKCEVFDDQNESHKDYLIF